MERSSVPALCLLGGAAWTVGQTVLPDMGTEWEERLAAVAADRPAQALATASFVIAGAFLVLAAVALARLPVAGRGATAVRVGTALLGLGGLWLAAGRGAFNLHMYQVTDPAVGREAARAVVAADVGPGFLALVPALPALLLGPVVLAVGLWRAGTAGRLPLAGLASWLLGIGTFVATEFTVKPAESTGVALAAVGLTVLGVAASRGGPAPAAEGSAVTAGAVSR